MAKKSKLYSEVMRELSLLTLEELSLYQMRWNIVPKDLSLIKEYGLDYYESIPKATTVHINALNQILASQEDSYERKEWADRIEGKTMQTTVNVNHDTSDGIEELEAYTKQKLDSIFREMADGE